MCRREAHKTKNEQSGSKYFRVFMYVLTSRGNIGKIKTISKNSIFLRKAVERLHRKVVVIHTYYGKSSQGKKNQGKL